MKLLLFQGLASANFFEKVGGHPPLTGSLLHGQLDRLRRSAVRWRVVFVSHRRGCLRLDRILRLQRILKRLDRPASCRRCTARHLSGPSRAELPASTFFAATHLGEIARIDGESRRNAEIDDHLIRRLIAVVTHGVAFAFSKSAVDSFVRS